MCPCKNSVPLGDRHNFGQCVCLLESGAIYKPRCIFWEHILLTASSTFRSALRSETLAGRFGQQFLLPDLACQYDDASFAGSVERIELADVELPQLVSQELQNIGATIGLLCWLGISDLHFQNIVFGKTPQGQLVFTPIDIEAVCHDFVLPSQLLLLPSECCGFSLCGLKTLYLLFKEHALIPAAVPSVCKGYIDAIIFLKERGAKLEEVLFLSARGKDIPIRLFIQSTANYNSVLQNPASTIAQELIDEERVQLQRGDIPYFFRHFDSPDIHYFDTRTSYTRVDMGQEMHSSILNYSRIPTREGLPARNVDSLLKAGTLQLLKFFLHSWVGTCTTQNLQITADVESLALCYGNKLSLRCAR